MFDWWSGSVVIMFPWDVHQIIPGCSRWVVSPAMASTDAKGRRNGRRNVKQLVETFAPKLSPKNDCFIGKLRTEPIFQGSRPRVEVLGLSFCLLTWQNFNEEAMYPLRSWPPQWNATISARVDIIWVPLPGSCEYTQSEILKSFMGRPSWQFFGPGSQWRDQSPRGLLAVQAITYHPK